MIRGETGESNDEESGNRVTLNRRQKAGSLFFLGLIVLMLIVSAGLWFRMMDKPAALSGRRVRITIPKGATPAAAGMLLRRKRLIRSATAFGARARWTPNLGAIKPGVYDISPSETPARILDRLTHGDVARLIRQIKARNRY